MTIFTKKIGLFSFGKSFVIVEKSNEAYVILKRGLVIDSTSDEIKSVLQQVRKELPTFGEKDSRTIVERKIMKLYFENAGKALGTNFEFKL